MKEVVFVDIVVILILDCVVVKIKFVIYIEFVMIDLISKVVEMIYMFMSLYDYF